MNNMPPDPGREPGASSGEPEQPLPADQSLPLDPSAAPTQVMPHVAAGEGGGVSEPPGTPVPGGGRRRRPWLIVLLAIVLALLLAGGAVLLVWLFVGARSGGSAEPVEEEASSVSLQFEASSRTAVCESEDIEVPVALAWSVAGAAELALTIAESRRTIDAPLNQDLRQVEAAYEAPFDCSAERWVYTLTAFDAEGEAVSESVTITRELADPSEDDAGTDGAGQGTGSGSGAGSSGQGSQGGGSQGDGSQGGSQGGGSQQPTGARVTSFVADGGDINTVYCEGNEIQGGVLSFQYHTEGTQAGDNIVFGIANPGEWVGNLPANGYVQLESGQSPCPSGSQTYYLTIQRDGATLAEAVVTVHAMQGR